jgi:hypothetical protein
MVLRKASTVALVAAAGITACERPERTGDEETVQALTLTVETPEALDWGGTGLLRVTLANEGDAAVAGGIVEVYVPSWLEFGTVEPAGTEVTVVGGDTETRLSYPLTDSLAPGERRIIVQHLRVLYRPPLVATGADSVETVQMPPENPVVRARLLTPAGEPAGAEVQATLHFIGRSGPLPPPTGAPDSLPPVDTTAAPPGAAAVPDTATGV